MKQNALTALNWQQRPHAVLHKIGDIWKQVNDTKSAQDYRFKGKTTKYEFFTYYSDLKTPHIEFDTTFLSVKDGPILDIGTGHGELVVNLRKHQIPAYGIGAQNLKFNPAVIKDPVFLSCENTEQLLASKFIQQAMGSETDLTRGFGCIVSHLTFCHLVDPACALMQAYTALKPGGKMLIDGFCLTGLSLEDHQRIIQYLRDQGHCIAAEFDSDSMQDGFGWLVIQKTSAHPTLDLPLLYSDPLVFDPYDDRHVVYKMSDLVPKLKKEDNYIKKNSDSLIRMNVPFIVC